MEAWVGMIPDIQKHVFCKNYVENLTFLGVFALFSAFLIFFKHSIFWVGRPTKSQNYSEVGRPTLKILSWEKNSKNCEIWFFFVFFGTISYKNSKYTYFPVRNQLILSGKQLKIHFFEAFFARFRYLKKGCSQHVKFWSSKVNKKSTEKWKKSKL